jgi:hypothetical protein
VKCTFRENKDLRFGMAMSSVRVGSTQRRDRLWLINVFAVALLTLLSAAGESLGYDRHLKFNTDNPAQTPHAFVARPRDDSPSAHSQDARTES